MQFTAPSDLLAGPAIELRGLMAADGSPWDQCLLSVMFLGGGSSSMQCMYRRGQEIFFLDAPNEFAVMKQIAGAMGAIFDAIERAEGKQAKVGVLCVNSDGSDRFDFDLDDADALDITSRAIGTPYSYFTNGEVAMPEHIRLAREKQEREEQRFAGSPVLEMSFRDDELGNPCPGRNIDLSNAVGAALGQGWRLVEERCDGPNDALRWTWQFQVLDLPSAVEKIGKTLRELPMASSVQLQQVSPAQVAYQLGLKDKPTLVREKAAHLVTELVRESLRCAPPSWRDGVLTIDTDGMQINYKLKSPTSSKKAEQISGALRQLCEELCVVMWMNGQRWRVATISFSRKNGKIDYKAGYSYEAAPPQEAQAPKAWWKFWA